MKKVTFITGNAKKAEFLEKYLGHPVDHVKIDLDEVQSLNIQEIVEHKVKQAYEIIGNAVLVEDISFSIGALGGKLPGPFIKWFIEEVGYEGLCRLADNDPSRSATTRVCYGYYDGAILKFFEGEQKGTIPEHPVGDDGFSWNCVFMPDGSTKTNAEMDEKETAQYSLRTTTVYPELKDFLEKL